MYTLRCAIDYSKRHAIDASKDQKLLRPSSIYTIAWRQKGYQTPQRQQSV
jgi:hypothetical protein